MTQRVNGLGELPGQATLFGRLQRCGCNFGECLCWPSPGQDWLDWAGGDSTSSGPAAGRDVETTRADERRIRCQAEIRRVYAACLRLKLRRDATPPPSQCSHFGCDPLDCPVCQAARPLPSYPTVRG